MNYENTVFTIPCKCFRGMSDLKWNCDGDCSKYIGVSVPKSAFRIPFYVQTIKSQAEIQEVTQRNWLKPTVSLSFANAFLYCPIFFLGAGICMWFHLRPHLRRTKLPTHVPAMSININQNMAWIIQKHTDLYFIISFYFVFSAKRWEYYRKENFTKYLRKKNEKKMSIYIKKYLNKCQHHWVAFLFSLREILLQ